MTLASATALVDALRQCRLLSPVQLEELHALQARWPDPQALAQVLLQRGWLTPYQASQLLEGKGAELVLGSYLLLERLGEGGMGQVFKARHRNLGRVVALKLIRKERLTNADAVRRFHREVVASAALSHPNIVLAYDADQIGDTHFLVMEYLEGAVDLARLVHNEGALPAARACELIRQAAVGLQHAHEQRMVHRDIKPHNLLLTAQGTLVKVLDLGLARRGHSAVASDSSSDMTMEGAVMGTPDYIAPEQALESHSADIRADIYSLGCTFYFLLAGRVPFPGGTFTAKLLKHQTEEPVALEQMRPDVPPGVRAVLRKMMAKRPADRYQTPAEVAGALAALPAPGTAQAIMAAPRPALPAADTGETPSSFFNFLSSGKTAEAVLVRLRPRPPARKLPWPWLGLAGGALLVVGLVLGLWHSFRTPEETKVRKEPRSTVKKNVPIEGDDPLEKAAALLGGKWYYVGPFDNPDMKGFHTAYPPEKEIDLQATYVGKNHQPIRWQELPRFLVGGVIDFLPLFEKLSEKEWACLYLYHEIEVAEPTVVSVSLGSDDALIVWLNGERLLARNVRRAVQRDDDFASFKLKAGKNQLLVKVCQGNGNWGFYLCQRRPWFGELPEFEPWARQVAGLPPLEQVEQVRLKLIECNPNFDGAVSRAIEGGVVTGLEFLSDDVTDLSPVRALAKLQKLDCGGSVTPGWTGRGKLTDLSPLKGLALTELSCRWNQLGDLAALTGMPLVRLDCGGNPKLADLRPLQGMQLSHLRCSRTRVGDLDPVAKMPLAVLHCAHSLVADLSSLQGMAVEELECDIRPGANVALVRSLPALQKINGKSLAQLATDLAVQQAGFEAWCQRVAGMPAAQQVAVVEAKVKELNPAFKGTLVPKYNGEVVTELQFTSDTVADLSPVRALRSLQRLDCRGPYGNRGGRIWDLTPLEGLPLTSLNCGDTQVVDLTTLRGMPLVSLGLSRTRVVDLAPLAGMALTTLFIDGTKVTDLAPLQGMPLQNLWCDLPAERLRSFSTLQRVNGKAFNPGP